MNKKILFIITPNFRDVEYFKPKSVLESAGIEVITASFNKGKITGADGQSTDARLSFDEIQTSDFDGITFIGGPGMVSQVSSKKLVDMAKSFSQVEKVVAAICVAPAILANADILQGIKVTAWSGVKKVLIDNGANYTGEKVTVDGNIITANGPEAAEEFGKTILAVFNN